jgi:hypothetical protein
MTDKEKLVKLLREFGVGFDDSCKTEIVCEQGEEKVEGYCGFHTAFKFHEDGSFEHMGAWE